MTDNEHKVTVYAVDINGVKGPETVRNFRISLEKELKKTNNFHSCATKVKKENLDKLTKIVNQAKIDAVSNVYVDVGDELVSKITKNLAAKDLLEKFCDYPLREYPEVEVVDPKASKNI